MMPKARTVMNRVATTDIDNYQTVTAHLLKEFKLTSREYRSKFLEAKKTPEETYTMFTAHLKNLLNYYVKSRQVNGPGLFFNDGNAYETRTTTNVCYPRCCE